MALNGWQRLWVVISVLLIFPAVLLSMTLWPHRDVDIVTDLASPDCKPWRELPHGYVPESAASVNDPCRALQTFLIVHQTNLRSVADYDRYLTNSEVKAVGWTILAWLGTVLTLFATGWSVGWVIRGFRPVARSR